MTNSKLILIAIHNDNLIERIASFNSKTLRENWVDAYNMRDAMQEEPVKLTELRFAVRWMDTYE